MNTETHNHRASRLESLAAQYTSVRQQFSSEILFDIAVKKAELQRKKQISYQGAKTVTFCFIEDGPNFANVSVKANHRTKLTLNQFIKEVQSDNSQAPNLFSIFVATNNTIAKILNVDTLQAFFEKDWRFLIVHDYDSHHWTNVSLRSAEVADLYIPAHFSYPEFLLPYLPYSIDVVPIGTILWTRRFLLQSLDLICEENRQFEVGGRFSFYPQFPLRNAQIATLNKAVDTICFVDTTQYLTLNEIEKLKQWTQYQTQIIIPVAQDVPIRFFDALVTGSLPIVPQWLIPSMEQMKVPREMYLTYKLVDLNNPREAINSWSKYFKRIGKKGIEERATFGLLNFHMDESVNRIEKLAKNLLQNNESQRYAPNSTC